MRIRKFATRQDCERAVQTQKSIWRLEDIDLLPAYRFFSKPDSRPPAKKIKKQTALLLPLSAAALRKPGVKNAAKVMGKFFKSAEALTNKGYAAAGIICGKQSACAKLIFKK